jgi:anti-sigma B factor antagonist
MKPRLEGRAPGHAAGREFEIRDRVRRPDGTVVLRLGGHLDVDGSPHLQQSLSEMLREGTRNVELDCTGVGFISSVGVGVVIVAVGEYRAAGGDVVVTGLSAELRAMFEMLGLTDYVTLG